MITKNQFCQYILDKFAKEEEILIENITEDDCLKSSCVAVALEHLEKITSPGLRDYASTRGGTFIMIIDNNKPYFLTAREMISLLPDEV